MIIQENGLPVERRGAGEESTFKIQASAQAFKILANNLYSNKIKAVVRELVCNAYDSHVEAGTTTPIQVHVPTSFEPWFAITDNGTGIGHEFMMDGYTTVFLSTKNGSNETIGGLGLGRLSAFAYSDSYTVTSRFNGIRRQYTVFLEQNGYPTVVCMGEEETGDPNGFEVRIPVREADCGNFENEVKQFFTKLSLAVDCNVDIRRSQPILKGSNWEYFGFGSSKVRMGLVEYPMNHRLPITFISPIGHLEIAPSREALSFTPETTKRLENLVISAQGEYAAEAQKLIDECETEWNARLKFDDLSDFAAQKDNKFSWRDKVLEVNLPINYLSYSYRRGSLRTHHYTLMKVSDTHLVYIDDNPKFKAKRIKSLSKPVYTISPEDAAALGAELPLVSLIPYSSPPRSPKSQSTSKLLKFHLGEWSDSWKEVIALDSDYSSDALIVNCATKSAALKRDCDIANKIRALKKVGALVDLPIFWSRPTKRPKHKWRDFDEFFQEEMTIALEKYKGGTNISFSDLEFFKKLLSWKPQSDSLARIKEVLDNSAIACSVVKSYADEFGVKLELESLEPLIKEFFEARPMMRLAYPNLDPKYKQTILSYV